MTAFLYQRSLIAGAPPDAPAPGAALDSAARAGRRRLTRRPARAGAASLVPHRAPAALRTRSRRSAGAQRLLRRDGRGVGARLPSAFPLWLVAFWPAASRRRQLGLAPRAFHH